LDDLKEARRYWKLKEEAQDRTLWRTQFGRGYGPVTRHDGGGYEDCYFLVCYAIYFDGILPVFQINTLPLSSVCRSILQLYRYVAFGCWYLSTNLQDVIT
jgi:hypothetical protein